MLDLKVIRANPKLVKDSIKKRWLKTDLNRFLELDTKIVKIGQALDEKRALKNKVSKEIPTLWKEEKAEKIKEMKQVWDDIKVLEDDIKEVEEEFKTLHRGIPNFLYAEIPEGKDDTENVVLRQGWKIKTYDFEVKDHHDL